MKAILIGLIGDHDPAVTAHRAIPLALGLAGAAAGTEVGVQWLGTDTLEGCAGFQHALLEYPGNALGFRGAAHAETHPAAGAQVIVPLSCELVEKCGRVVFEPGSVLAAAHDANEAVETYHCRYGLSPAYELKLAGGPLQVTARDAGGDVRAMELGGHPFFVLTLYQPERAALERRAHPLANAFVAAAR